MAIRIFVLSIVKWPFYTGFTEVAFVYMRLDVSKPVSGVSMSANLSSGFRKHQWPRLISTFVVHFLESIISKLATGEISIILLVSAAEETGLNATLAESPKTVFVM